MYCCRRPPTISFNILKKDTRLLLPAPLAPIITFNERNSMSNCLMDLNPCKTMRFNVDTNGSPQASTNALQNIRDRYANPVGMSNGAAPNQQATECILGCHGMTREES